MRIDLRIGGFVVALDEAENLPVTSWPVPMYDSFCLSAETSPDISLSITVVKTLPDIPSLGIRFDSEQGLWRLADHETGYLFESLDPRTLLPRCRALLARDYSQGQVWICEDPTVQERAWSPLDVINPLGKLCLLTRLTRAGGLMLHAAGILADPGAWVFTGDSGTGKSTLSGWCSAQGMTILNDERIIIRSQNDQLIVWGTPWVGTEGVSLNQSGQLARLHVIRHSPHGHRMRPLAAGEASQRILRQCTVPHWDPDGMDGMLRCLSQLITKVECVDLSFENNPDVLDYLKTATGPSIGALS